MRNHTNSLVLFSQTEVNSVPFDFYRELTGQDVTLSELWAHSTGGSWKIKNRRNTLLYCHQKGMRRYFQNDECVLTVHPKDVIIAPVGCSYSSKADIDDVGNYSGQCVEFCLRDSMGIDLLIGDRPYIVARDRNGYYSERINAIQRMLLQGGLGRLAAKAELYQLLHAIALEQQALLINPAQKALLPAIQYMESHLNESVSIDLLAEICFMSRSTFYRRFQAEYGMPPVAWHLKLRLEKSAELLRWGDATVEQVAEIMGFYDAAYFSRAFYRQMGLHAGELRRTDAAQNSP